MEAVCAAFTPLITRSSWRRAQGLLCGGLSYAEAASVPIGALTAWQGLSDRLKLQSGESLLVHGGAGTMGIFVVQLARQIGAQVVATASAQNAAFLKQLGADEVIDY